MKVISPISKRRTCEQTWNATPNKAFPLLCPVRETDWIPGWSPKLVISNSGLMELDCIFVEPDSPNDATWIVTRYIVDRFVEMYRVAPNVTVSKFSIELFPYKEHLTHATIAYEHVALSEAGEKIVAAFTEDHFNAFMEHFNTAINHYLTHGEMIDAT